MFSAASTTDPTGAVAVLLQYGALGVVVLFLGWFAWTTIQRERARADRAEAKLLEQYDSVVPALVRSTEAIARLSETLPLVLDVLRKSGH